MIDAHQMKTIETVNYLRYLTDGDETLIAPIPAPIMAGMISDATIVFQSHRMAAIMVWSVLMGSMIEMSKFMVKH